MIPRIQQRIVAQAVPFHQCDTCSKWMSASVKHVPTDDRQAPRVLYG